MSPMTPIIFLIILMYAGMRRRYLKDMAQTTRLVEEMNEVESETRLRWIYEMAVDKLMPYRQHPQIDHHFQVLKRELATRILRGQLKHVRRTENKIIYN
jgi:uncharacterized heparinase superfamily protein